MEFGTTLHHEVFHECLIVLEERMQEWRLNRRLTPQQSWSTRATKLEGIVSVNHWQGMQELG